MVARAGGEWQADRGELAVASAADDPRADPLEPPVSRATRSRFPAWAGDRAPTASRSSPTGADPRRPGRSTSPTGTRRQVSDEPVGVEEVQVLPDGRIAWWHDATGDERGRWLVPGPSTAATVRAPVPRRCPTGWSMGMSMSPGRPVAVGLDVGRRLPHLRRRARWRDARAARIERPGGRRRRAGRPDAAGSRPTARSCASATPSTATSCTPRCASSTRPTARSSAELDDGRRRILAVVTGPGRPTPGRSPASSATVERPAIWEPGDGARDAISPSTCRAPCTRSDWCAGRRRCSLRHEFEARAQLLPRSTERRRGVDPVTDPRGDIEDAGGPPGRRGLALASDAGRRRRAIATREGDVVVASPDRRAARRRAATRPFRVDEPRRRPRSRRSCVTPAGDGRSRASCPCTADPSGTNGDAFDPEAQAFVDAGYAVALVNYRGSTGYGIAFREALIGDVCLPESEDIIAVLDALVADGIADPERVVLERVVVGRAASRASTPGVNPDRGARDLRGDPGRRLRRRALRASAPELQAWDDAAYRRQRPRTYRSRIARSEPDDLRGRACRAGAVDRGRARPPVPARGHHAVGRRASARTVARSRFTRTAPATTRTTSSQQVAAHGLVLASSTAHALSRAQNPHVDDPLTRTSTITVEPSSIGATRSYCGNFSYSSAGHARTPDRSR